MLQWDTWTNWGHLQFMYNHRRQHFGSIHLYGHFRNSWKLAISATLLKFFLLQIATTEVFTWSRFWFFFFPHMPVKHQLLVDSKSLFETITTLHQTGYYRMRKMSFYMQSSQDPSGTQKRNIVRWIPERLNFAIAITKRNGNMHQRLNKIMQSGEWTISFDKSGFLHTI